MVWYVLYASEVAVEDMVEGKTYEAEMLCVFEGSYADAMELIEEERRERVEMGQDQMVVDVLGPYQSFQDAEYVRQEGKISW